MSSVKIQQVVSKSDFKAFHQFPYDLYAGNKNWTPLPKYMAEHLTSEKHNPHYEYTKATFFLAYDNKKVTGRIGVLENSRHQEAYNDKTAYFGFFEAANAAAAAALYEAAEETARTAGYTRVIGPLSPTLEEGPGFQLNAFDTPNYILTPYTMDTYPGYAEENGYVQCKDTLAFYYDWEALAESRAEGARLKRVAKYVRRKLGDRLEVKSFKKSQIKEAVAIFAEMYHASWKETWGYVQRSSAEFDLMAKDLAMIYDENLIFRIMIDGKNAGICLCLPDVNELFRLINGKLFPTGWIKYLQRDKHISTARLIANGVMPEFRNMGVEVIAIDELAARNESRKYPYKGAELSWVLADNPLALSPVIASGAQEYKRYRIFEKQL